MISAERETIVILDPPVSHVERRHGRSKPLTEILAHRKIKRRMLRQIIPRIGRTRKSIAETRPVINVAGEINAPRQRDVAAQVQRIALVVVERREFGEIAPGTVSPPMIVPAPSAIWFEYARCTCPRCAKRGDRSVTSHPRTSARETATGKKMLEAPMLLWSRKLTTLV